MNHPNFKLDKSNMVQGITVIITLIINAISYYFLPSRIGIQINSSGISNSAPKLLYLCISFLVIALLSYWGTKPIGSKKNQYTIIAIFLAFLNMFTIILNLIFLS